MRLAADAIWRPEMNNFPVFGSDRLQLRVAVLLHVIISLK